MAVHDIPKISLNLSSVCASILVLFVLPSLAYSQMEILEFYCPSSGHRERCIQGADPRDEERNVQQIIVVCERSGQIRSVKIPLDEKLPVRGEPLLARKAGTARSEILAEKLPHFLVPGNTCPLFPITAYLRRNICPADGSPGFQVVLVGP